MEEHKLLTGMLLAALVVSVAGAFMTLDQLGSSGFTGAATGTGTSTATITADLSISVSNADNTIVAFGSGVVDSTDAYAVLYSEPTEGLTNTDNSSGWAAVNDNLSVQNNGNTDLNITVKSSNKSGIGDGSFVCQGSGLCTIGGGSQTYKDNGTDFAFKVASAEVDATNGQACKSFGYAISQITGGGDVTGALQNNTAAVGNLTNQSWNSFVGTNVEYDACKCLQHEINNDEIAVFFKASVPQDAGVVSGGSSATLTFTSSAADSGDC